MFYKFIGCAGGARSSRGVWEASSASRRRGSGGPVERGGEGGRKCLRCIRQQPQQAGKQGTLCIVVKRKCDYCPDLGEEGGERRRRHPLLVTSGGGAGGGRLHRCAGGGSLLPPPSCSPPPAAAHTPACCCSSGCGTRCWLSVQQWGGAEAGARSSCAGGAAVAERRRLPGLLGARAARERGMRQLPDSCRLLLLLPGSGLPWRTHRLPRVPRAALLLQRQYRLPSTVDRLSEVLRRNAMVVRRR